MFSTEELFLDVQVWNLSVHPFVVNTVFREFLPPTLKDELIGWSLAITPELIC